MFISKRKFFLTQKKSPIITTIFLLLLLSPLPSFAQSISWDAGIGQWQDANNWNPNTVPTSNDDVTVSISGSQAQNASNIITVGDAGTGSLSVLNNAFVDALSLVSGTNGGTGTVTVSDGGSSLSIITDVIIAQSGGTSALTVSNGGFLASTQNGFIGVGGGSNGTVIITGAGSRWLTSLDGGQLLVGQNGGTGLLTIEQGGLVNTLGGFIQVSGGSTLNLLGSQSQLLTMQLQGDNTAATVNFDGGVLVALASNSSFITSFSPGSLQVNSGGLFINSSGNTLGADSGFTGVGGITLLGGGSLLLSGNSSGITGINNVAQNSILNISGNLGGTATNVESGSQLNITGILGGTTNVQGASLVGATGIINGATNILAGGQLTLTGTINGATSVQGGGQLNGIGTINGTTTVSGTVAPGVNSIGTLIINGDYIQAANSFYQVDINPQGQGDLILITGAASINSSARVIVSGIPTPGLRYRILTATRGVSGQYQQPALEYNNLVFFDYGLLYDATNVYLEVVRRNFNSVALTPNQLATATAIDSLVLGNEIFDAFLSFSDAQTAREALDDLSGEIHASSLAVFTEESRYLREAVLDRLQQALSHNTDPLLEQFNSVIAQYASQKYALWTQGVGSWGDLDGNYNTSEVDRSTKGLFLGADIPLGEEGRLGLVGGYTHSNFDADHLNSAARSDNFHIGLYGGKQLYPWDLKLGAAYTWHNINTSRNIAFPGFRDYLSAFYMGGTAQVFGELGYRINARTIAFEPLIGAAYVRMARNGFSEQGGAAALVGASASQNIAYSTVGVRETAALYSNEKTTVDERLFIGWRHAYSDINPLSLFGFASGSLPFLILGVPIAQNAAIVDAGLEFKLKTTRHLSLRLSYIGQWASEVQDNGAAATFTWRFS